MKLRKLGVSVLALLLLISSLQLTAFAEDGANKDAGDFQMPNMMVVAAPGNGNCTEIDKLQNVKDAKVILTKDADPAVTVELPLVYEKDLGGFIAAGYLEGEAMKTVLADLAANQAKYGDLLKDFNTDDLFGTGDGTGQEIKLPSKAQLSKKLSETLDDAAQQEMNIFEGYTVTLEGLPEGHYTFEHSGVVLTSELMVDIFDLMKTLFGELLEIPEMENAQTIQELLDSLAKFMEYDSFDKMLLDMEATEEELKEIKAAIAMIEDVFAQAKAGTFEGILVDMGVLVCECPELDYFEIYHEYYKEVNGKRTLVARIAENSNEWGDSMILGEVGSYIRAEDWMKCDYDGTTYDFVNSYDSWVVYDDEPDWKNDIVTEFKLGDPVCYGLVLRYVHVAETETSADTNDDADQSGEDAPLTGDHTPIGLYVALLATALIAIIVLFAYKKRKNQGKE